MLEKIVEDELGADEPVGWADDRGGDNRWSEKGLCHLVSKQLRFLHHYRAIDFRPCPCLVTEIATETIAGIAGCPCATEHDGLLGHALALCDRIESANAFFGGFHQAEI